MIDARKNSSTIVSWLKKVSPEGDLFADSRDINATSRGAIFCAYEGDSADGRNYINAAIKNGAKAILYEASGFELPKNITVPTMGVIGLKEMAGPIASLFYDNPSQKLKIIAITGTNGKTSSAQWLSQALSLLGKKSAVIGTLGVSVFEKGKSTTPEETGYTTPDQVQLQRILHKLCMQNVQYVAMEASSIGIDQGRLNGLSIDMALFTNFTRDHLDYHGDMASYKKAKRRLFDWKGLRFAVINLDDAMGQELSRELKHLKLLGVSQQDTKASVSRLLAKDIRFKNNKISFKACFGEKTENVHAHVIGRFNVSNLLGVLGILIACDVAFEKACKVLSQLVSPPGRMQQLGGVGTPLVVIDFAHTPDALEKGIETLSEVAKERKGKLWCVFGCGGNRDPGKRPQMGKVSQKADVVVITSDNPRNESPQEIINSIASGMSKDSIQIEDRARAILYAVRKADVNDVIFLAGKGHETYQEIAGIKYPFLDAEHVSLALNSLITDGKGKS